MTITELWQKEYQLSDGRCALCEGRGLLHCNNGTRRYCICPDGRGLRKANGPMATEKPDTAPKNIKKNAPAS